MKKYMLLILLCCFALPVSAGAQGAGVTPQVSVLKGEKNYLTDYSAHNLDGTVNVVVEIPAGTTAKYEVDGKTGMLVLEQKNGKPRYVQYLGYPGNYGLIPRTVLPKELGGDGDPLDAIVLGDPAPVGSVVKAWPIGVLTLKDHGEEDSKVIMAAVGSPFEKVSSIKQLDEKFPGITQILQIWFTSYKGKDKDGKLPMESKGVKERTAAVKLIGDAALAYETGKVTEADKPKLDPEGNPYQYFSPQARNISD